ncbi:hypothetical protein XELAEV_18040305mg [Xenopus laevis]|uniref:G-protein coupled receptors family 1 profile domain-containing protein n=1 Tax=Xenopus laevis TaxID=8355 RepID=A0A974C9X1_XENLA|nr:hypothetical protein XELAEV_18040305mg [Xenopus laevis]
MSYDRYVAICNPLRYNIIMVKRVCFQLISSCWMVSFGYSLTHTILTSKLPFCGLNEVSHFFCDIKPLLKLACADTSLNESLVVIITGFIAVSTFCLIFLSYSLIGTHLLKIRSSNERRKAFSTCTSHLIVVLLYYGPLTIRFLRPATSDSLEQDRQTAVLYTIITPFLNPIIYALRNQDVKMSLKFRKLRHKFVPKMMSGLMIKESKISVQNCIVQIFFFHFFGCTEAMLLTTMSYDRYVAICIPLRYNIIMAKSACFRLISGCWVLSVFYSLTHTILTSKLPFCRVDRINHFFCDIKPLLMLACADASLNENLVTLITGFLAVSTSSLIFLSYVFIGIHLVKVRSAHERRKAFSTCTSHLTVVFLFYGPLITRFLRPATNDSLEQDRQSALLYTTVTPVLNPLIYALRNQEVKRSLKAIFHGKKAIRNQL